MESSNFQERVARQFGFALKDPNPNIRFLAIEGLQFLSGFAEGDLVRAAFTDSDRFVRWKAFQVAGILKIGAALPELVKQLHSFDVFTRQFAVSALGNLGKPEALEPILEVARKDGSPKIKQSVLRILTNFQDSLPWDFIKQCCDDEDVGIRQEASRLLGMLKNSPERNSQLVDLLEKETETHVFATALLALGRTGDLKFLPLFQQSLLHAENRIRANAVEAFLHFPLNPKIEAIVTPLLDDPSNRVKANAIAIFFKNGLEGKVHWNFQKLLTSANRWERASGAWLAGQFQRTGVVDILLKQLLDEEAIVAERSAWALAKIKQPGTIDALIKGFAKANQWALSNIIKAMQGVATKKDVPKIYALFEKERNPLLKAQFIDLFSEIKAESMTKHVLKLTQEGEHRVRSSAYIFLGAVDPEKHKEILFEGISDPHHKVRGICAEIMLKNGDFRALKILSTSLKEQEKLKKIETTQTLRNLAELLKG